MNTYSFIVRDSRGVSSTNAGKNDCFQVTTRERCSTIPEMDFESLAKQYQAKTDDELQHLATQRSQLTNDAWAALSSELAARRIDNVTSDNVAVGAATSSGVDRASGLFLRTGKFLEEVLVLYRRNRRVFISLILPAVVIGYVSVLLARSEARSMARQLHPDLGNYALGIASLKIQAISSAGYFVSWMAFCASFAAICFATERTVAGFAVSVRDVFVAVWERFGDFLKLSFLLLLIFVGLEVMFLGGLLWTVVWLSGRLGYSRYLDIPILVSALTGVLLLILSRFALAMPALVLDDYEAGCAIFRSDELTRGKLSILASLLFKSVVGGYIAGMLPFWLARWIPANINLPWWFGWSLTIASVCAVTMIEPVMFIGFALLYLKTSEQPSAQATQLVITA
ncbi:MAG TPA: hypothetical protein VHV29_14055 [Terriglobales bacterium]|nr:hypothetical protein [Terriglobales bacterium]